MRLLVPFALGALALAACRDAAPDLQAPDADSDPFTVVLSQFPAEPDQPPLLHGDTLVVRVRYEGDCEDHAFAVDQHARRDTVVLTLRHDARGDECAGEVYDELSLGLPEPLPFGGVVLLRNPRGGPPFKLR